MFTWTPSEAQGPGAYSITVRVADNGEPSLSATNTFTVSVNEVNSPPTVSPVADRTVAEGSELSFIVTATDPDLPAQPLQFALEPVAPAGARIDPGAGVFSWTPGEEQGPSTNRITVRVTDNSTPPLSDTKTFTVVVNEVNSPPVIAPIADKFLEENTRLEFKIEATDLDVPKNGLVFSLAADAPPGASVDPKTGVFSWTANEVSAAQTNRITVVVTDDGAPPLAATNTFQVVVTPAKLRLAPIPDRSEDEGTVIAFAVTAVESSFARLPLTYDLEPGAPEGALISPTTGAFLWQPTEAQGPSTNKITVRVTDSSLPPSKATRSFTMIVREVNRPPVLEPIPQQRVALGQLLKYAVKAQDSDLPANNLTYSLEPGVPTGASIDAATGLFTWTPGPAAAGSTNTFTVKVTDNGSPPLSHTVSFTVVVTEPEGPKLFAASLPNGQFQLTLTGEIGRIYLIQASTDLIAWEPVTNLLSTATTTLIADPASVALRHRFYRAVSP